MEQVNYEECLKILQKIPSDNESEDSQGDDNDKWEVLKTSLNKLLKTSLNKLLKITLLFIIPANAFAEMMLMRMRVTIRVMTP